MLFGKKINADRVAQSLYEYDPDIGFWGAPNVERYVETDLREEPVHISHNSDGNRDKELHGIASDGTIVVIGGSHSWGAGVDNDKRFSNLLSDKTGKQVINMAHASLGIDQICIAIMKKTEKYNPKIIILEQYPWAVIRILSGYVNGYVKPSFSIDEEGKLKLRKVPKIMKFPVINKIVGTYYSLKKEIDEFRSGIDIQSNYDPLLDPIFLYWKIKHYDYLYELLEKILIVVRDYCRQKNIHLLLSLGAIHQQFSDGVKSELIDFDLPIKRLQTILDKLSIEYVDLSDELIKNHSKASPVIFHDGHINEKGNEIISIALANTIESKGWL